MILLDAMAQRYHLLPTHCLRDATTLDLEVMFVSQRWQHRQTEQARDPSQGTRRAPPRTVKTETLQAMMDRVRQAKS